MSRGENLLLSRGYSPSRRELAGRHRPELALRRQMDHAQATGNTAIVNTLAGGKLPPGWEQHADLLDQLTLYAIHLKGNARSDGSVTLEVDPERLRRQETAYRERGGAVADQLFAELAARPDATEAGPEQTQPLPQNAGATALAGAQTVVAAPQVQPIENPELTAVLRIPTGDETEKIPVVLPQPGEPLMVEIWHDPHATSVLPDF